MNMYMCLSLLTVTANVVQRQFMISHACNHLVHRNERVLSVVRQQDDIKHLCVVVILSLTFEALVEVVVHLIASTS